MNFINELYCGKGTDSRNGGSDTAVASYNGCIRAAEQIPMKAGGFAALAFVLGAAAMFFYKRGGQ